VKKPDLIELARACGLRDMMLGTNTTDARAVLEKFAAALTAADAAHSAQEVAGEPSGHWSAQDVAVFKAANAAMPHTNPELWQDWVAGFNTHMEPEDVLAIFRAGLVTAPQAPAAQQVQEPAELIPGLLRPEVVARIHNAHPGATAYIIQSVAAAVRREIDASPPPKAEGVAEALELAANRLDSCAVAAIAAGLREKHAWTQWAQEARAALSPLKDEGK
jgi:hypothetical protein